jgi:hypothetical protein
VPTAHKCCCLLRHKLGGPIRPSHKLGGPIRPSLRCQLQRTKRPPLSILWCCIRDELQGGTLQAAGASARRLEASLALAARPDTAVAAAAAAAAVRHCKGSVPPHNWLYPHLLCTPCKSWLLLPLFPRVTDCSPSPPPANVGVPHRLLRIQPRPRADTTPSPSCPWLPLFPS